MVTFTLIGIGATSVPLHLPWLPLVAPPAVVVMFLLAAWPFLRAQRINPIESGPTGAG
jgi:ABC-type antimicrobial peptide transport system permease subunit